MKKLGGCSVTPTSGAKFDWSVDIFATTVTQSGLAANATAKQVNCQTLIAPCPLPPDTCTPPAALFLLQSLAGQTRANRAPLFDVFDCHTHQRTKDRIIWSLGTAES
jgi:hypothetical protein